MAAAGWRSDTALNEQIRHDYERFDFYQLVRLLRRASVEPERGVRFRSDLSLAFPANEVTRLEEQTAAGTVTVTTSNYGIGGNVGPLPEAYAEWAQERSVDGDRAMADFFDLFNHRLNVLRYLIKARASPALADCAPEDTAQAQYLDGVAGFTAPGLASQLPLSHRALLGLAGLLANQRHSAATIERVLARYFSCNARVSPFIGAWRQIPADNHTRLRRANSRLGRDTVLGQRHWDQAACIGVYIGRLSYAVLKELVPGGARHAVLVSLLRFLTDRKVDCRVTLEVAAQTPPTTTLRNDGSAVDAPRLRQTTWLPRQTITTEPYTVTFFVPAYDDAVEETERAA